MNQVMLSLRQAIMKRVEGKSETELKQILNDAIDGDEKALPGIGVLFEIIWKNCSDKQRQEMITILHQHIPKT